MTPRAPHVPVGVLFSVRVGDVTVMSSAVSSHRSGQRWEAELRWIFCFLFFKTNALAVESLMRMRTLENKWPRKKRAESPDCALTHRFSSWTQRIYKFSLVQARKQPHGPATKRWRYVSPESRLLIVRKSPKFNVFLMYERRLDIALAFIAIAVSPLLLECGHTTTCEVSLTQWFYRFIELLFTVGKYLKRIRFITSKSDVWWVNASFFFLNLCCLSLFLTLDGKSKL